MPFKGKPGLIWGPPGLLAALLSAKDIQLQADVLSHAAWPSWLSLASGLMLALGCGLQSFRPRQTLARATVVACLLYAFGNLLLVMRLASIGSLVAIVLAGWGLALSLLSFRSPPTSGSSTKEAP